MFKNAERQQFFETYGFTSFPLLSQKEVADILNIYSHFESSHHASSEKFRGTGWIDSPQVISNIDDVLHPVICPLLQLHFQNYQALGFGFLMKEPGADSAVPPHQDWTYVDEHHYYSMNVWIALEEMTIEKGCMWVIPRSHRMGDFLRPAPAYPWPYREISDFLQRFKKPVQLKAGECLCFNNKLIHGSYPNKGNTYRLAAITTLYPQEAQLLHYYVHERATSASASEYAIDKKVFLTMPRGMPPPQYVSKREVKLSFPQYSKSDFFAAMLRLRISDLLHSA